MFKNGDDITYKLTPYSDRVQTSSFVNRKVNVPSEHPVIVRNYVSYFLKKARHFVFSTSISTVLWCVLKLLSMSRSLENVSFN